MRPLILLLLAVVLGESEGRVIIKKCCDTFQMLSSDMQSCVDAPWPKNHTFLKKYGPYIYLQPTDEPWIHQWLPPGIELRKVRKVSVGWFKVLSTQSLKRVVESSSEWNEYYARYHGIAYWHKRVVFLDQSILRRESRNLNKIFNFHQLGHLEEDMYCVDATQNPRARFALFVKKNCDVDECVNKCCAPWQMLEHGTDGWRCKNIARSRTLPGNSTIGRYFPTKASIMISLFLEVSSSHRPNLRCRGVPSGVVRLTDEDQRANQLLRHRYQQLLFYTWDVCIDYERREDEKMGKTIFYCQYSRITRGVYWLLRPLSFVSVAVLAGALLSIVCNSGTRRKAHGWCLACYGACLLAFNMGQVVYYLTLSDEIDTFNYIPPHLEKSCHKLAWPMYFLLTAANSWLTAVCFNLAISFGKLHVRRMGCRRDLLKFLALSVFGWGLPALMTGLCHNAFDGNHLTRWEYKPSLFEIRTCYNEVFGYKDNGDTLAFIKNTRFKIAYFFYAPMGILVTINLICIARTLKTIQFLRRGNSVLHREEHKVSRGLNHTEAENPRSAGARDRAAAHISLPDAKTIRLYVKMLLMTGIVEMVTEFIVWHFTQFSNVGPFSLHDHTFAYRATGYMADFFRAACVAWLAAPDGGYLDAVRRLLASKKPEPRTQVGRSRTGKRSG